MTEKVIQIQNLSKSFGSNHVLKDISVDFYKGDTVSIIGPNGAGKTTFIEILCSSQKPTSGKVNYLFTDSKNILKVRRYFGVQFQEGTWPEGLSAFDIIKFYRGVYPGVPTKRIKRLIDVFEIREFIKRPLVKLSGGQKQRFNAFLAVMHEPRIVFFDEVTTGLDIQLQYKILNYIRELCSGHALAVMLVSHGPEEVEALSNRVLLVHDGNFLIDMSTEDIIKKYGTVRNMMNLYFENKLEEDRSYEKSSFFKKNHA